jgi:glutamate-1-semialdehyde 2,1-aminomutase
VASEPSVYLTITYIAVPVPACGPVPAWLSPNMDESRAAVSLTGPAPLEGFPEQAFAKSKALQKIAHELIPGGCHTYAKGDDQYPELAPGFLVRGRGCHVWDADGNEYIEYGMGLRAVTLGHGYPSVVDAAYRAMLNGTNFTRPSPIEVECAQAFLGLIDGAEMVKFAKNGSDVTTAAVKLARAHTGRDLLAICEEHPFFSTDDWFIGSTPMAAGIPGAIRELTLKFHYNDLDSVRALFERHPGRIACLVMEAATTDEPRNGFLRQVHALCAAHSALFILDEVVTGFRFHLGGAQKLYGVTPDLSAFGKGMANGFPLAALAGKRDIMERGGLRHEHERVFLLSTTYGAETSALAAAIETMRIYRDEGVVDVLRRQGERLRSGVAEAARASGVDQYFGVLGNPSNLVYVTRDREGQRSQQFRALFLQELIRGGVLAPSFVVSYAHQNQDLDRTVDAVAKALAVYRRALDDGVEHYLVGRAVKPVFRRFN